MFFLFLCIIYPIVLIYGQCPALTITTSYDGSNGFCLGDACQNTTGDTTTVLCSSDGNTGSKTSMVFTIIDGGTNACNGAATCNSV
uniref:ET module n=1 Tax=Acrobeloides nanus TaxID=290746 RepID=A0A914DF75_9BILA